MMDELSQKPMDRYLSRTDVFAMAIGVMVGWGAFVMPGTTFLPVAGPAGSVLALAIGALLMLVIGANFAWLMRRSSRTGGVYAYTKEAFGAIVGFGYTSAAAWKLGRMEGERRVVASGIAGTAISVAFAVVQLVPRMTALEAMGSEAFLLLAIWCLLGFIFYLRTVNETTLAEFTGMSTSGVTLFALLLYSALMWIAKRLVAESDAAVRGIVVRGGVVLMLIVFVGLAVMMYIQNLIRKKHEVIEREKIRAVETAENGQIAVDRVAASEPGYYNLVLMDIQMPVMDGYTATRTIRALEDPALAGVPIVAMTANAFAEDVQAAREAGMQAHIAKPVDIAVLHRTLQDVLRGRRS